MMIMTAMKVDRLTTFLAEVELKRLDMFLLRDLF